MLMQGVCAAMGSCAAVDGGSRGRRRRLAEEDRLLLGSKLQRPNGGGSQGGGSVREGYGQVTLGHGLRPVYVRCSDAGLCCCRPREKGKKPAVVPRGVGKGG